jgi:hypothetical protein
MDNTCTAKYLMRKFALEKLRYHGGVDWPGEETTRQRADEHPPVHYWIASSARSS